VRQPSFKDLSRSLLSAGTNPDHTEEAVGYVLEAKEGAIPAEGKLVPQSLHILMANTDPYGSLKNIAAAASFLTTLDHDGGAKDISPEMGARLIDALGSAIEEQREAGNDIMEGSGDVSLSKELSDTLMASMDERSSELSDLDKERFTAFSQMALISDGAAPPLLPFPALEEEHMAKADETLAKAFNYDRGSDENDVVVDAIAGLRLNSPVDGLRLAVGRIYADEETIGVPHDAGDVAVRIVSDVAMQQRAQHGLVIIEESAIVAEDDPVRMALAEASAGKSIDDPRFIASLQKEASGDFSAMSAHASIDIRSDCS